VHVACTDVGLALAALDPRARARRVVVCRRRREDLDRLRAADICTPCVEHLAEVVDARATRRAHERPALRIRRVAPRITGVGRRHGDPVHHVDVGSLQHGDEIREVCREQPLLMGHRWRVVDDEQDVDRSTPIRGPELLGDL